MDGAVVTPSVLVVDDHPTWRVTLGHLLNHKGARVVGDAADGDAAVAAAELLQPDVVLMDLDLPTIDGIEATRRIRAGTSGARVLMLSGVTDREAVDAAAAAGASGYLVKTTPMAEIAEGIRRVACGEQVFPNGVCP